MINNLTIAAALILSSLLFTSCKQESSERPNIILIYADDLGIGLLGTEGQEIIKTPNIDKLAKEGARFNNAYSCMLCAPARASLISGLHDCHAERHPVTSAGIYKQISTGKYTPAEVEDKINSVLPPVAEDHVFLAQAAKEAGYKTAQFGKLEWGFAVSRNQMKRHGWDRYLGYMDHIRAHGFYPPFLYNNGELMEIEGNTHTDCAKGNEPETPRNYKHRWDMRGKEVYSQNIFMDSLLQFIEKTRDEPFFVYFPTQLPHGPVSIPAVHPDFENDSSLTQIEKEYASMVKMLDDNVGQIMDKLKEQGIDDNTMVIFTSDNGHEIYYPMEGRTLKPYTNMETGERFNDLDRKYYSDLAGDVFDGNGGRAGLKRSNLQGGIRVPLLIRWPEGIKAGVTSNRMTANYDILPTLADIVGFKGDIKTDGLSFYNTLIGKTEAADHDFIVYSSFHGPTIITNEGWKLRTYLPQDAFELFYLPDDYKEEKDLKEEEPEKFEELKALLLKACDGDYNNGLYSRQINVH